MGDKLSKNKILIIIGSVLVVAIVVLVVIITNINKDTGDETSSASSNITTIVESPGDDISVTAQLSDADNTDTNSDDELPNVEVKDNTDVNLTENKEIKVTLGEYKGIKVNYTPVIISDDVIESNLKQLQDEYTEIIDMPDQKTFEEGDMAIVSYEGKVDGEVIDQLDVVCLQVVIGKGMLPDVIEEKIIGKKKKDVFDVEIEYPTDYTAFDGIAGKTVVFTIDLVDGFVFDIPEINDLFISEVTDYPSVDSYKKLEKERLQNEQNEIAHEETVEELKRKVVDNCSFEGDTDSIIKKNYVMRLQTESNEIMENYWMDVDTYYQMAYGYEPGEYSKELMSSVSYDTKYLYVLDEIAKQENIQVSDDEFEEFLVDVYMPEYGFESKEDIYLSWGEDYVKSDVNTAVLRTKASELVFEAAVIEENNG